MCPRRRWSIAPALLALFLCFPAPSFPETERPIQIAAAAGGSVNVPDLGDVTGIVAWYRGTDGTHSNTTCSAASGDGANFKCLQDLGPNGYNVSQDSPSNVRVAGGDNGLVKSHLYNGGAGILTLSSASSSVLNFGSSDARTIFARFSVEDETKTNGILGKVSAGNGWFVYNYYSSGAPKTTFGLVSATGYRYGVYVGSFQENQAIEAWYRYTGGGAATDIKIRFNRNEVTEDAQTSGTLGTTTTNGVFKLFISEGGTAAHGINIEEIAIFNRELSTTEIGIIETTYLTPRYGSM